MDAHEEILEAEPEYTSDLGYDDDGDLVIVETYGGKTYETKFDELPDFPVGDPNVPFIWHLHRVPRDKANSTWFRL